MATVVNSRKTPISLEAMIGMFPQGIDCHGCRSGIVLVSSFRGERQDQVWVDLRSVIGDADLPTKPVRLETKEGNRWRYLRGELTDQINEKVFGLGPVLRFY